MWNETIQIEGPYNMDRVLERLSYDSLNEVDLVQRRLRFPYYPSHEVVNLEATGTTEKPEFQLSGGNESTKAEIIDHVYNMMQWNHSLKEVHSHFLQTDLKPIFEEHVGTPIILDVNPFACLVRSIIHQQLNMAFAHTLTKRFVEKYGDQKEGIWFYPSPEVVASIKVEDLREMQFSQRKAEYVIGLGQWVIDHPTVFHSLENQTDEEIMDILIKIRGVGPWTIESFLMFGLGRHNLFLKADVGLQNAIKLLYKMDRKPTAEELETMSEKWRPYMSYASMYLWRSIEGGN